MASDQYQRLAEKLWAAKGRYREVPVEQLRAGMEAMAFPVADDVQVEPVTVAGTPAEWVRAPAVDRSRVLLYLHGGGYVMGSLATHRKLAGDLSRAADSSVLLLDYPLAPEAPFPAGLEAAVAAHRALADEFGSGRLAIAGDSAGGGLALATLVAVRDRGHELPAAAALLSPWVDLLDCDHTTSDRAAVDPIIHPEGLTRMRELYVGSSDPAEPLVSPALADLSGLPPLLIQIGEAEVLFDEGVRLATAAEEAGVDVTLERWPEMPHVWQVFAGRVPEATEAVETIGRFVAGRLAPT